MSNVNATLTERGERYGSFSSHAKITGVLKADMQSFRKEGETRPAWESLTFSQREALDMIAHKIGRILNGDPNYSDSWHDIAGYSTLVEDEINGQQTGKHVPTKHS